MLKGHNGKQFVPLSLNFCGNGQAAVVMERKKWASGF